MSRARDVGKPDENKLQYENRGEFFGWTACLLDESERCLRQIGILIFHRLCPVEGIQAEDRFPFKLRGERSTCYPL